VSEGKPEQKTSGKVGFLQRSKQKLYNYFSLLQGSCKKFETIFAFTERSALI
jgi:hypothetical protein